MSAETLTSIAALVVLGAILVPVSSFFIMNKIHSNQRKNVIIDLSSLD